MTWDNLLAFWLGTVFMGTVYSLIRWRVRRRIRPAPQGYRGAEYVMGEMDRRMGVGLPITQEDARSDIQVLNNLLDRCTDMTTDEVKIEGVMTTRERRVLTEWMNTNKPERRPPRRTVDPMKSEWDDVPPGWLNKSEEPIIPRREE